MLLPSHPIANPSSAHKVAALRLPFSGDPGRTAGENFQTPRLLAPKKDGQHATQTELDNLFASQTSSGRTGEKSEMSAGVRPNRSGSQTRLAQIEQTTNDLL